MGKYGKRLVNDGNKVEFVTAGARALANEENVDGINIIRMGNNFTIYPKAFFFVSKNSWEYDIIVEIINGPPFLFSIKVPPSKHILIIFHLPTFITIID